jgi:hypothetical protein
MIGTRKMVGLGYFRSAHEPPGRITKAQNAQLETVQEKKKKTVVCRPRLKVLILHRNERS